MSEDDKEASRSPEVRSLWGFVAMYARQNGTLVFGVLTCLSMWVVMAQPELHRNAERDELIREALHDMDRQLEEAKALAEHQRVTAEILDRIVSKLDGDHE